MTAQLQQFIKDHSAYFWYTPEKGKENVSEELIVETILNEGSMDDVRALFDIMGIDKVADIFFSTKGRAVNNYYPEIRNFFTLVFNRYAHRNS